MLVLCVVVLIRWRGASLRVVPHRLSLPSAVTVGLAVIVATLALWIAASPSAAESLQKAEASVPPDASLGEPKQAVSENFLASRTPEELYPTTTQLERPGFRVRKSALYGMYAGGYAAAWKTGTRHGIQNDFRVMRLESAYGYDFIGHVYATRQMGLIFTSANRWAGLSEDQARRTGVWWGAFGMMTFMEILNGFMPGVRFDPLDIPANFIGAWSADGGLDLAERHPQFQRFSLQFGFQSWSHAFDTSGKRNLSENLWHDYPNGRFGLGYDVGPLARRWMTVFATYEITSMNIATLQNRFGMGVELPVFTWASPFIGRIPGGKGFLSVYDWVDDRILMPVLYIQLFHVDTGPWSQRPPFAE